MTEREARHIVADIREDTRASDLSDDEKKALKIVMARLNQLCAELVREELQEND